MAEIAEVLNCLNRLQLDLSDEKRTQEGIAGALGAAGIPHAREAKLSTKDIVDFLVSGGLGIEVKLKGARKMAIFKQLERYARHDVVTGLLLVTSQSMGLPAEIGGKPAYYLSLGRAWL